MVTSKTALRFLAFMVMCSAFLPVVFVNLPPVFRSHHIWTTLWLIALPLLYPNIFREWTFVFTLIYGLFVVYIFINTIYAGIDYWNEKQLTQEFYQIIVGISIFKYFQTSKDYYGMAMIVKWTFIFMLITAILSIVTSYINPLYARELTGLASFSTESERNEVLSYRNFGGGSYGLFQAIICLFPLLIYFYRNQNLSLFNTRQIAFFIIVFLYCLVLVQFFANVLITLIVIILSVVGSKRRMNTILSVSIMFIIALLIPQEKYIEFLVYLSNFFDGDTETHYKLLDMATYLSSGDTETTGIGERAERFPLLLESFLSNPLTGGVYWNGHLYWMNKLAVYGLMGFIPFCYLLLQFIRTSIKQMGKEYSYYFLLSVFSIIALGLMKALAGRELWYTFFFIAPGFHHMQVLKYNKMKSKGINIYKLESIKKNDK